MKIKTINIKKRSYFALAVVAGVVMSGALSVSQFADANSYKEIQDLQAQIKQVEASNGLHINEKGILSVEAASIADAINKLQEQINASQARISELENEIAQLEQQIADTEVELAKQRDLLGQSIKAIYVSGEISTVEMLATSKNLSDFFDKQQYQESVRKKVKTTLDKITALKLELNTKKQLVNANLTEQIGVKQQIEAQQAERNRILALNQAEQNELEAKIRDNNGRIAELKRKQAEAEAALARSLSSGSYKVANVGPVAAGDVVGAIGNTGFSTGPHLHLEVRTASGTVNPSPYIQHTPVNIPPAYVSQGYAAANSWYNSGYHMGIDYASNNGAPIFAIASGQLYRGCSSTMLGTNAYGYVAIVEHADGSKSIYAHMSGGPSQCNFNTFYR